MLFPQEEWPSIAIVIFFMMGIMGVMGIMGNYALRIKHYELQRECGIDDEAAR